MRKTWLITETHKELPDATGELVMMGFIDVGARREKSLTRRGSPNRTRQAFMRS